MVHWTASNLGFRSLLLGLALSGSLAARLAHAEGTADTASAQQLFDEARTLMKKGDYAQACAKLTQSQALDPGGGTLLNLGICHAKEGRTATAYSELRLALAQATSEDRADREGTAQKHLDELTPLLCHLTLLVQPAARSPGLIVELDGARVDSMLLDTPIPLDPGPHQIRASQQAHKPWSSTVTIAAGHDQQSIEIPPLEAERAPPAPLVPSAQALGASKTTRPSTGPAVNPVVLRDTATPRADTGIPRWASVATLGFGAVAIGVGSYFGIRTLALRSDSNQDFNGSKCTEQTCVDDWKSARREAVYSDIAIGVGLAALGVGTYLVLAPKKQQQRASRGPMLFLAGAHSGATLSAKTEF